MLPVLPVCIWISGHWSTRRSTTEKALGHESGKHSRNQHGTFCCVQSKNVVNAMGCAHLCPKASSWLNRYGCSAMRLVPCSGSSPQPGEEPLHPHRSNVCHVAPLASCLSGTHAHLTLFLLRVFMLYRSPRCVRNQPIVRVVASVCSGNVMSPWTPFG